MADYNCRTCEFGRDVRWDSGGDTCVDYGDEYAPMACVADDGAVDVMSANVWRMGDCGAYESKKTPRQRAKAELETAIRKCARCMSYDDLRDLCETKINALSKFSGMIANV